MLLLREARHERPFLSVLLHLLFDETGVVLQKPAHLQLQALTPLYLPSRSGGGGVRRYRCVDLDTVFRIWRAAGNRHKLRIALGPGTDYVKYVCMTGGPGTDYVKYV